MTFELFITYFTFKVLTLNFIGCGNVGGKRKYRILSEEKPKFVLVRMQRWCGFAKDDGDIKVPAGFEIRDILDNNDITNYEIVGLLSHIGQSFLSGHYFSQIKIGTH